MPPPWDDADLPEGMAVVRRRPETDSGLARHPLVVTRRGQGEGEVVGVQLLPLSLPALRGLALNLIAARAVWPRRRPGRGSWRRACP